LILWGLAPQNADVGAGTPAGSGLPRFCRSPIHTAPNSHPHDASGVFPNRGGWTGRAIGDEMHRGTSSVGASRGAWRLAGPAAGVLVAFFVAATAANLVNDRISPTSAVASIATVSPASRISEAFSVVRSSAQKVETAISRSETRIASAVFAPEPTYDGRMIRAALSEPIQADAVDDQPAPTAATAVPSIPIPRPRPSEASVIAAAHDVTPAIDSDRQEDPTLLEKLSGMFKLASLRPTDGIFAAKPDLGALGYDGETAVYDISAHALYLPDGSKLEAHSGIGDIRDDPNHVSEARVGATPPAVYELKPREQLFHGVQALRMNPVEGSALGRTGLLVHSYMLGPNGDSNGCVSVRDYDRFLAAYQRGDVKRLAVVPTLASAARASSL
jgi:hypothetical protein